MSQARLYGRVLGNGSHVQVTRGFQQALSAAGLLAGQVHLDLDEVDEVPPGASAPVAVFTGPLNMVAAMRRNADHRERWTLVAPNSDKSPPRLLATVVEHSTRILTPSDWGTRVVQAQLTELGLSCPVSTAPHGIAPELRVHPEARATMERSYQEGAFKVLHFSTSDRQRKGTRELLQAWQELAPVLGDRAHLILVLDPLAESALRAWCVDEDAQRLILHPQVSLLTRLDCSPADMARVLSSVHVVCQPSRGEGFGLVPLEARACGVPVVMTDCTGHSQHTHIGDPGVLVVPTYDPAPIDDWEGARAPALRVPDLIEFLAGAHALWPSLNASARAAAPEIQSWWSWPEQLRGVLDAIRET
jgi:glycosyltransferase involved in cell wall biosynthesis